MTACRSPKNILLRLPRFSNMFFVFLTRSIVFRCFPLMFSGSACFWISLLLFLFFLYSLVQLFTAFAYWMNKLHTHIYIYICKEREIYHVLFSDVFSVYLFQFLRSSNTTLVESMTAGRSPKKAFNFRCLFQQCCIIGKSAKGKP